MNFNKNLSLTIVLSTLSGFSFADDKNGLPFPGILSGNVAVLSSYDFRGITNAPENDKVTLQAGLEYAHPTGFYLGYWGSTLGYSLTDFDVETEQYQGRDAFENDFNLGYRGKINDDLGYSIGGTYYYYYQSEAKSDFFETLLGLNYKDVTLSAQTATSNVDTANRGDTYFLLSYSHQLPFELTGRAALGGYLYAKNNKNLETKDDFNFRHLTLGLTHALGNSGANMNLDYIVGGYDRMDEKQKNKVVFALSYNF